MYRPPAFGPIDFDDADQRAADQPVTRWLSAWRGSPTGPAEHVALGWASERTAAIIVATSTLARLPHKSDRRVDAVRLAFGGQLPLPAPVSAEQVQQAVEQAGARASWQPSIVIADGMVCTGAVSTVHDVLVGHARVGTRVVTFAAVGLTVAEIRLRTPEADDAYGVSPWSAQSPEAVADHLPDFGPAP